ncbi:MAG: diguanylate cyclase, partial [Spirochaetota bacterium]
LAGATAVQTVSSLYVNGIEHIRTILNRLQTWMDENNYIKISDFRGSLNLDHADNPQKYEREQFMKYRSSGES